jgi:uncharacterized protein YndB with AHSA1/START domain
MCGSTEFPGDDARMTTEVSRRFAASRHRVYEALTTGDQVAQWRFPGGMTCEVHEFEPVVDGRIRVSLTYTTADGVGKSGSATDTYSGRFTTLVPDELVVEVDEFETDDPTMRGEMTMTIRLTDAGDGGTLLSASHEGVPEGVSPADNELGWRNALERLAQLVEQPRT